MVITILSIFPFPLLNRTENENNILLKLFLYTFPFYTLLTCSYEGIFLILYYSYLQLWIKMQWREKINDKKLFTYNLIDILIFIFITYDSFYSLTNVLGIMDLRISSTYRFVPENDYRIQEMILVIARTLLPGFFVTAAFFEITKKNNYSNIDSFIILNAVSQIMNIKFFFGVKDHGSWQDIGMGIAYIVISGVIPFMQILTFSIIKCIFWRDLKTDKYKELKGEEENIIKTNPNIEVELGIKNSDYQEIE